MNHTILVRCQLHKCAEVHNSDNLALHDGARFDVCHDALDNLNRACNHLLIGSAYGYASVVGNVDLNAGLLDNLIDYLTLLADNITDLLRIDGDLLDLRSVLANLCARLCDCLCHNLVKDVDSCFSRSSDGLFDDRSCQAVNLDIHLNRGDTLVSTANLEIHVAEEIFQTLDIG